MIDWQKKQGGRMFREIQYSTINRDGILTSYDIYHEHFDDKPPKIKKTFQTLQAYRANQLESILEKNGFEVLRQCGVDGSRLSKNKTERILTIGRKL